MQDQAKHAKPSPMSAEQTSAWDLYLAACRVSGVAIDSHTEALERLESHRDDPDAQRAFDEACLFMWDAGATLKSAWALYKSTGK